MGTLLFFLLKFTNLLPYKFEVFAIILIIIKTSYKLYNLQKYLLANILGIENL